MTRDEIEILVAELGPGKARLIAVPGVTPPTRKLEQLGIGEGVGRAVHAVRGAQRAVRRVAFVGGGPLPAESMPPI